ncbi:hypothetical protein BDF19DRAFT_421461 [Syncephalis fuscata]|nr:hypothetical protein BDF19DRAFT_421461 [Syncephalis fuscata]
MSRFIKLNSITSIGWTRYQLGSRYFLQQYKIQLRSNYLNTNELASLHQPLPPTYDPKLVEHELYDWWEQQGLFTSRISLKKQSTFSMLLPPPNVTGALHIGHALTAYIQDAIVRWKRMQGESVQWIPGTDHASIATQTVVEKRLWQEQKKRRTDMTRDEFLSHVWTWRQQCGDRIFHQLKRAGASLDWTHSYFTMDKTRSEAVSAAFCRLYDEGFIYRDTRLVNWCCALRTVISDIEIEYEEISGRTLLTLPNHASPVEFGVLHWLAYPLVENQLDRVDRGINELVVGTTRIETVLADCALAVHPNDERYKSYIGRKVKHPITQQHIPIIADDQLVDPEFGTGIVKITPAHDPNDYACARRHQLPIVNIFNLDGTLNEQCHIPELNKNRFEVRSVLLEQYKQQGYYRGADTHHVTRIGRCSRTGDIIEPMIRPQWQVYQMYSDGSTNHIHDWCVSRQLWWGHRIPAYKIVMHQGSKSNSDENNDAKDIWVVANTLIEAQSKATVRLAELGHDIASISFELHQDHDVLDTWFSSGLLPLSGLGWTGNTSSIPNNYPLNLMETGSDILFFWVARMAMLCTHLTGGVFPFNVITLHPMVRDAQGRKMSKSLGNVIDPLHVIDGQSWQQLKTSIERGNLPEKEKKRSIGMMKQQFPNGIPACGSDALRLSLLLATQQTRQINMDINNVISANHFANKLWNLTKLTLSRLDLLLDDHHTNPVDVIDYQQRVQTNGHSLLSQYILSRLAHTTTLVDNSLKQLNLSDATDAIKRFILDDLCDTFVEYIKPTLYHKDPQIQWTELSTLLYTLEVSLRLLHPMMPFITERLWQQLQYRLHPQSISSIMIAPYPNPIDFLLFANKHAERDLQLIRSVVHASRSLRQTHFISISEPLPFMVWMPEMTSSHPLTRNHIAIQNFINAPSLSLISNEMLCNNEALKTQLHQQSVVASIRADLKVYLPVTSIPDRLRVISRFEQKLSKIHRELGKIEMRMNKLEYTTRVPLSIRETDEQQLKLLKVQQHDLDHSIRLLQQSNE